MPINVEEYEEHDEDSLKLTPGTNADTIMQFLSVHPEQGFTPKEIHEATGVKRGSVGVVLHRLEKRDLVRHIDHYWTLGEDTSISLPTPPCTTAWTRSTTASARRTSMNG